MSNLLIEVDNEEYVNHILEGALQNQNTQPEPVQSTTDDFKGDLVPLQVRVPSDLRESLKLLALSANKSMSDLVLRCLTTDAVISRTWIQTRKKEDL